MSLKNSRSFDARVTTLSCGDMYIIDAECNGHFMNLDALVISAQELRSTSNTIPLFVSSNVTFAEDVAIQMDLIVEGNIIGGTSGTLHLVGNVDITDSLTVEHDAEIRGNLIVDERLCVFKLLSAKDGVDIIGETTIDGGLTVVQDVIISGNLTVFGNIEGNVNFGGNVYIYDLFVHNIFGFSPIHFQSPCLTQHSITLSGISNFLQTTFGAKIQVLDGGDAEIHGGNLMITPVGGPTGGGQLMVNDGGDVHVAGGNLTVTAHNITGKGSIAVLDGGDINLRNGGNFNITEGGNVNIMDGGNVILTGGSVVFINPMTMAQSTLSFAFTGCGFDYWGITLPAGFIWASGRTIGNASSNATERASSDTLDLFTVLWDATTNTTLQLYTSLAVPQARGGSALADFNANMQLAVPDKRGRVSAGIDNIGGSAATRLTATTMTPDGQTIAATGGAETHTLSIGEMPSHDHTGTTGTDSVNHAHNVPLGNTNDSGGGPGVFPSVNAAGSNTSSGAVVPTSAESADHTHSFTTNTTGSSTAFDVLQPTIACNYIIKL